MPFKKEPKNLHIKELTKADSLKIYCFGTLG